MVIQQLPQPLVDKIRTGITTNSVPQAIAELLANSVDAKASNIVIKLSAGTLTFSVEDDGFGIRVEDLDILGSRYCTSKMRLTADLQTGIHTLGFRGEAVSSLLTAAEEVHITSRAKGSFETWTKVARSGGAELRTGPSGSQLTRSGTIVSVERFLFNQPVRQRQMVSQYREIEAATIQAVLHMGLPFSDVGVTLLRAPTEQVLLRLPKGRDLPNIFLRITPDQPGTLPFLRLGGDRGYTVSAVLGSLATAYPHQQHQYVYVNRRYVLSPPLSGLLNAHFLHAYQKAGYQLEDGGVQDSRDAAYQGRKAGSGGSSTRTFPAFLVVLECPPGDCDVTAEPDKSDVVFKRLPAVQNLLRGLAERAWGPGPRQGGSGEAGDQDGAGCAHQSATTMPVAQQQRQQRDFAVGGQALRDPRGGHVAGAAALAAAGASGRSVMPVGGLQCETAPTLDQMFMQPGSQALPERKAVGPVRPTGQRSPRPLRSLLQLQASGWACQLGESKTMSLAAIAPSALDEETGWPPPRPQKAATHIGPAGAAKGDTTFVVNGIPSLGSTRLEDSDGRATRAVLHASPSRAQRTITEHGALGLVGTSYQPQPCHTDTVDEDEPFAGISVRDSFGPHAGGIGGRNMSDMAAERYYPQSHTLRQDKLVREPETQDRGQSNGLPHTAYMTDWRSLGSGPQTASTTPIPEPSLLPSPAPYRMPHPFAAACSLPDISPGFGRVTSPAAWQPSPADDDEYGRTAVIAAAPHGTGGLHRYTGTQCSPDGMDEFSFDPEGAVDNGSPGPTLKMRFRAAIAEPSSEPSPEQSPTPSRPPKPFTAATPPPDISPGLGHVADAGAWQSSKARTERAGGMEPSGTPAQHHRYYGNHHDAAGQQKRSLAYTGEGDDGSPDATYEPVPTPSSATPGTDEDGSPAWDPQSFAVSPLWSAPPSRQELPLSPILGASQRCRGAAHPAASPSLNGDSPVAFYWQINDSKYPDTDGKAHENESGRQAATGSFWAGLGSPGYSPDQHEPQPLTRLAPDSRNGAGGRHGVPGVAGSSSTPADDGSHSWLATALVEEDAVEVFPVGETPAGGGMAGPQLAGLAGRSASGGLEGFLGAIHDTPDANPDALGPLGLRRTVRADAKPPSSRPLAVATAASAGRSPRVAMAAKLPSNATLTQTKPVQGSVVPSMPAPSLGRDDGPTQQEEAREGRGQPPAPLAEPPVQQQPVLVGMALPVRNGDGSEICLAVGGDPNEDEESSLSPLARFLTFSHIGSDPGVTVTPPSCNGGTSDLAATPLGPLLAPTAGGGMCDCGSQLAASNSKVHLEGASQQASNMGPSAFTPPAAATPLPVSSSQQAEREPLQDHNANTSSSAKSAAASSPSTRQRPSVLTEALAVTGAMVPLTPPRLRLLYPPTRLIQSAPPHAKRQARAVHGNPESSVACSRVPPDEAGLGKGGSGAVTGMIPIKQPAAFAVASARATTLKTPADITTAAPPPEQGGAAVACAKPAPGPQKAGAISVGLGAAAAALAPDGGADATTAAPRQCTALATVPQGRPTVQGNGTQQQLICNFFRPARRDKPPVHSQAGQPAQPGTELPGHVEAPGPQPSVREPQKPPVSNPASTAARGSSTGASCTGPILTPQPPLLTRLAVDVVEARLGDQTALRTASYERATGTNSSGCPEVPPSTGGSRRPGSATPAGTGILKKRAAGSAAHTPKRVRFQLQDPTEQDGALQAARQGQSDVVTQGTHLRKPAATPMPLARPPPVPQQEQQQRGPKTAAASSNMPAAKISQTVGSQVQPPPLPSGGTTEARSDEATMQSSAHRDSNPKPSLAEPRATQEPQAVPGTLLNTGARMQQGQQQQRQVLPTPLWPAAKDEKHLLCLDRDLLRLAAIGEALIPTDVSRATLQQAAGPGSVMQQVDRKFIPAMSSGGMLLILDQHAAHERVRLEHLTAQLQAAVTQAVAVATAAGAPSSSSSRGRNMGCAATGALMATSTDVGGGTGPAVMEAIGPRQKEDGEVPLLCGQRLPAPLSLQLTTQEAATVDRHAATIAGWGWSLQLSRGNAPVQQRRGGPAVGLAAGEGIDAGGQQQVVAGEEGRRMLVGVPVVCGTVLANPMDLRIYLHQLHETGGSDLQPPAVLRVLRSKACRSAVMFGDPLGRRQCGALLEQLRATQLWTQCAHGRPTVVPLVQVPALRAVLRRRQAALGVGLWVEQVRSGGVGRKRLSAEALREVIKKRKEGPVGGG